MVPLTKKEGEALLLLFKDFTVDYNANSLSKKLETTPRGTLKMLKHLQQQNLLIGKQYGKAVFYKPNLEDYYTFRSIETLLIREARTKVPRWLSEFKELFKNVKIAILFGSIIRNEKKAKDIDMVLVFSQKELEQVKQFIEEKNKILIKPVHPIIQTIQDLQENLEKKDPVVLNALRYGCVLYGYEKLIDVVKNVTSV